MMIIIIIIIIIRGKQTYSGHFLRTFGGIKCLELRVIIIIIIIIIIRGKQTQGVWTSEFLLVKTEICPCQELNPVRTRRGHFGDPTRIIRLNHRGEKNV